MENINLVNEEIGDINFFLEKREININNIKDIINILNKCKEKVNSKWLIDDINAFEKTLTIFQKNIKKEYFENIQIVINYLDNNYHQWLVDQLNSNDLIDHFEILMNYNLTDLDYEKFEEINKSILIIYKFFIENTFLNEDENKSINDLEEYINNPIINNYDNIIILLINLKDNLKTIISEEKDSDIKNNKELIKEEIEEKLDLFLPEIINNLYINFYKLFNRRRNYIESKEIQNLQESINKTDIYINENKEMYWDIIVEQFNNCKNRITSLDIEKIKEFNENEVHEIFESFTTIVREISKMYKE